MQKNNVTYSPRPIPLKASASPPLLCSTEDHTTKLRGKKWKVFSFSCQILTSVPRNPRSPFADTYVRSQHKIVDGGSVRDSEDLGRFFIIFLWKFLVLQSLELHYQEQGELHFSKAVREWLQREEETNINPERYFLRKKYLFWKSLCTKIRKFSHRKDPLFSMFSERFLSTQKHTTASFSSMW